MANSTVDAVLLFRVYACTIEGFVFGLCNLLIGLSVLKHSALRHYNQYVLLMTLAFADAGNLFGYFFAGIYWLWLIYTDRLGTLVTPVQCLLTPHTLLWLTAYPFSALMLVILSCDRLFMVTFPSFYILSLPSPKYANLFVLFGLLLVCSMAVLAVVHVIMLPSDPTQDIICYLDILYTDPEPLSEAFVFYFERIGYLASMSVLIFIAALVVRKFRVTDLSEAQQRSQNRMTKTVAISCLCTTFLFCVPDRLGFMAYNEGLHMVAWMCWLFSLSNPAANMLIYELRHHEMRLALKALLTLKPMPQSLTVWPKPNQSGPPAEEPGVEMAVQPAPLINNLVSAPGEQMRIECS